MLSSLSSVAIAMHEKSLAVERPNTRQALALLLGLLVGSLACGAVAAELTRVQQGEPVISQSQIEADWLRQEAVRGAGPGSGKVTPEEDALGGCDGVKNGKWGFHTEYESNPWWQVDLQQPTPLACLLIYNRTDIPQRASRLIVLLSDDAKNFRRAYQHDGSTFLGHADSKPLRVELKGAIARYLRIQLPGTEYFHLDEVEVYPTSENRNIALGKPATQSSTSQWSVRHAPPGVAAPRYATDLVIQRGLKLAESLRHLGVNVDPELETLRQVAERVRGLPANAPDAVKLNLHRQARWAVRKMAFKNPLVNFDTILFVKSAPGALPHMSDQFYGWFSRPGGGVFLLEGFKSTWCADPSGSRKDDLPGAISNQRSTISNSSGESPRLRCLTSDLPEGSFYPRPDLSYDGKRILFSYCRHHPDLLNKAKADKEKLPEDCFYHLFEMNIDGTGRRQLTHGRYDDFDARYLPNGEIAFLSTRKGQFIQCGKASASATQQATLPDSYVRCGGGDTRPVAVFTLHVMERDGGNLRAISAFENFEWTPQVGSDGRILYARWDYIDRFNGPFISLWSTNPDGTNPQLVYGNFTVRPQCVFEAQPIPGSRRLVFTASAHHSITGGALALLDPAVGTEEQRPITRLTPEVCFPETEGWPNCYYANPYPLSEEFYLVAWSNRELPPHGVVLDDRNPVNAMGIYLYDAFGNMELLYRDPGLTSMYPIPARPRPKPPVLPSSVDWDGLQEGYFLLQDVYQGLVGIPRGTVKGLRVVGVPPKTQPQMNSPNLGVSSEDPGKFVLGTVPVEADGSAYFRVPSGVPVFFQALDADGVAVQTMRTLTYVQPRQTLSCIGCHESRTSVPPSAKRPLAAFRGPSKLTPGPPGTWPLRFDQLVQPVLDKHCVSCHRLQSGNEKAARLDLTSANSYNSLLTFASEDLKKLALERDRSVPGQCTAAKSKLLALVKQEHEGVRLEREDLNRLVTWMDVYAQRQGSFSDAQEAELLRLRKEWANLMVAQRP